MMTQHTGQNPGGGRESDLLGSIFLLFAQVILAVFGSAFTIVSGLAANSCAPSRSCNYSVLAIAGYLPAIGGAIVVIWSVATLILRQRQRRSSWRTLAIGVAVVAALIPVAVIMVAVQINAGQLK